LKKILVLILFVFSLSGCAVYKFQKPAASGAGGYLACYDGKPILEYTVGKEKSLPELTLAQERFKRRRPTVERYYKQMGQIEPRLKALLWDPPVMIVEFLGGVLRWPLIAVADYKYNHNPKYKARMDRLDEEKETLETMRVDSLRKELAVYIAEDLAKESLPQKPPQSVPVSPVVEEVKNQGDGSILKIEPSPLFKEEPPVAPAQAPAAKVVLAPLAAVIIAQPIKGYSPLKVNFSGQKSHSKSGKIVAYLWDFGDGDTSIKKNPENTYWSTTFGPRNFTATLTVKDDAGNTAAASTIIEVITR